jgi:hypothetical protein
LINKTQHDEIYYITSHFFWLFRLWSGKAFNSEDVPEEVKKIVDCNTLVFVVTKQPEFPGGLNEFRRNFQKILILWL